MFFLLKLTFFSTKEGSLGPRARDSGIARPQNSPIAYPAGGHSLGAEWGARGSASRPIRRAATAAAPERQTVGATELRTRALLVPPESAMMRGGTAGG